MNSIKPPISNILWSVAISDTDGGRTVRTNALAPNDSAALALVSSFYDWPKVTPERLPWPEGCGHDGETRLVAMIAVNAYPFGFAIEVVVEPVRALDAFAQHVMPKEPAP